MQALGSRVPLVLGLILVLAAIPLAGCGGSSAGPGLGPVSGSSPSAISALFFLGDYFAIGHRCSAAENVSRNGPLLADGAALLRWGAALSNNNGSVGSLAPVIDRYRVSPQGALGWNETEPDGLEGGLVSDGDIALVASSRFGATPAARIAIRLRGPHDLASFRSSYFVAQFQSNNPIGLDPVRRTRWGTIVFNDRAQFSHATTSQNANGVIVPTAFPGGRNYTVDPDGVFEMEVMGVVSRGGLHPNRSVAIAGGGNRGGDFVTTTVLIQKSALKNLSSFSGEFWVVGFEGTGGTFSNTRSLFGTATADGAGTLTFGVLRTNTEGILGDRNGGAEPYDILPSGALDVGNGLRMGHLSPDDRFAVLVGGAIDGTEPFLYFLAKK